MAVSRTPAGHCPAALAPVSPFRIQIMTALAFAVFAAACYRVWTRPHPTADAYLAACRAERKYLAANPHLKDINRG